MRKGKTVQIPVLAEQDIMAVSNKATADALGSAFDAVHKVDNLSDECKRGRKAKKI